MSYADENPAIRMAKFGALRFTVWFETTHSHYTLAAKWTNLKCYANCQICRLAQNDQKPQ